MTDWLEAYDFSYKKPKGTPAKANAVPQEEFIMVYHTLLETRAKDEPILFGDGVHLTMVTKITRIKKRDRQTYCDSGFANTHEYYGSPQS